MLYIFNLETKLCFEASDKNIYGELILHSILPDNKTEINTKHNGNTL